MPKTYSSDNVLPTIPEPKQQKQEENEVLPELSDDVTEEIPVRKEEEMFDVKPKQKKKKKKVVMEVKEDLELDIDKELSKLKTTGRSKGQKDTKQRKKRYGGGKQMSQQALDNLAKARAKAAANRKRRKELLELKKKQEEEKSTSFNKMEKEKNTVKITPKQVISQRRQPTKEEIEANFFNMMDKYYVKRDKMKAERKKKAQLEAKTHQQKQRQNTKPTPSIVKQKSYKFNNWDSLF